MGHLPRVSTNLGMQASARRYYLQFIPFLQQLNGYYTVEVSLCRHYTCPEEPLVFGQF